MARPARTLGVLILIVILVACTHGSTVRPIPSSILSPAPRSCPMGTQRGDVVRPGAVASTFHQHLPVGLPSRFGLAIAWTGARSFSFATWSDAQCEQINLSFVARGGVSSPQPAQPVDRWRVDYDKANACGNAVLGSGRCIGYTTRASDGGISVQFIGLSRTEADRIVRSIPL